MFLLPHVPHDAWRRKNVAIDLIFFSTRRVPLFLPPAWVRLILNSNGVPSAWVRLILDSNGVRRARVRLILDSNGLRRAWVRLIGVSNNKSKQSRVNI